MFKKIMVSVAVVLLAIFAAFAGSVFYSGIHAKIFLLSPQVLAREPICHLPSYGLGPAPTHIVGFPIPFVTEYAAGNCAWESNFNIVYQAIDILLWFAFIMLMIRLISKNSRKK